MARTEPGRDPEALASGLRAAQSGALALKMITNRGVKVFPDGLPETFCTDHWRCRFVAMDTTTEGAPTLYEPIDFERVVSLLSILHSQGFDVIKTENLYEFDGKRGFSLGQGE